MSTGDIFLFLLAFLILKRDMRLVPPRGTVDLEGIGQGWVSFVKLPLAASNVQTADFTKKRTGFVGSELWLPGVQVTG